VFLGGVFIPPSTLSDELGTLLITFFGIMSAGVIPAISLLVSSTLSSSLSVKKLDDLKVETETLVRKLVETLAFLVIGAILIMADQMGIPKLPSSIGTFTMPSWFPSAAERSVQSGVLVSFLIGLDRLRLVGSSFKRVLNERYQLSRADSELRIKRNGASVGNAEDYFSKSTNFGEEVKVPADPAESN
jgi:hypothetical protein